MENKNKIFDENRENQNIEDLKKGFRRKTIHLFEHQIENPKLRDHLQNGYIHPCEKLLKQFIDSYE